MDRHQHLKCASHELLTHSEENAQSDLGVSSAPPQRDVGVHDETPTDPTSSTSVHHGLAGPAPAGGRSSLSGDLGGEMGRSVSAGRRGDSHGPAAAGTPGAGPLVDGEAPPSAASRYLLQLLKHIFLPDMIFRDSDGTSGDVVNPCTVRQIISKDSC